MIEGFATNIMQQKEIRDAQNLSNNTAEIKTLNKLDRRFNVLDKQYMQASANLSAKTNQIITRTSAANTNLNKNITLGTVSLPITDNGNGGYVTGKGVFKSYPSQGVITDTAGKNGCSSLFTQVQKNKFSDSLIQGTPMQTGQACGNEGKNVYVSGLNNNPTATYVGCYSDKNTTDANTAMTYDSNAIGITSYNTCKQYASDNGYSYFGMQNLQSSGLAQCVVSNNSIDTIKNNGDASVIVTIKPLWSSKTNSSVSNSMKLNNMGQLTIFNIINNTENIIFSTTNTVPECINSGKINVTSASYDIDCNKIFSGFTNLFSTIEGFKNPVNAVKNAAEKAAKDAAEKAKAAAEKAAAEKAALAKAAAAAKNAFDSAARSISMASIINSTRTAAAERSEAERAAIAKAAADKEAAEKRTASAAAAAAAAAAKAAADRAAAAKAAADREAEDKRIKIAEAAAKARADKEAQDKAAAAKAEADRAARATAATQKVSSECNNKNNCSISANSLFGINNSCNFNVAYTCGTRPFTNSAKTNGENMILDCDKYINNNCTFYLLLQNNGSINIYKGSSPPVSGPLGTPVYTVYSIPSANKNQINPNKDWLENNGKGNFISMNSALFPGEYLCSKNGSFKLIMQDDGNLVLYTSVTTNGCPKINNINYGITNINAVYKINENNDKGNLGKVAYIDADANLREYPETMLQKSDTYTLYNKYDSIGNDIINNGIDANNVNDCKTKCNANKECAGFVYKPADKKCYLKNVKMYPAGDRQRVDNSNFTMGVRKPEIIPNVVNTCNKTIIPIDSIRYNAYKKGDIMNETVNCGITQELTQEQSIFDAVKTSLSNLKDNIIGKSGNAYVSYTKNTKQIIPAKTQNATSNTNENTITKAEIDVIKVNGYNIQEGFDINMNDVNSMLSDSDITILQSNYSYIMWSVLAVGLLSVTINTVKYS